MFTQYDPQVFSAMQEGKPVATYKKTILGKVFVNVLSPFDGQPVGLILEGDPKKSKKAMVDTWNEREDLFFRRQNARHFEIGNIIKIETPVEENVHTIEQYSDEELLKVLNKRFLGLKAEVNKIDSEATLYRLLAIAREEEKSESIVKAIESRLSEIQLKDLKPLLNADTRTEI